MLLHPLAEHRAKPVAMGHHVDPAHQARGSRQIVELVRVGHQVVQLLLGTALQEVDPVRLGPGGRGVRKPEPPFVGSSGSRVAVHHVDLIRRSRVEVADVLPPAVRRASDRVRRHYASRAHVRVHAKRVVADRIRPRTVQQQRQETPPVDTPARNNAAGKLNHRRQKVHKTHQVVHPGRAPRDAETSVLQKKRHPQARIVARPLAKVLAAVVRHEDCHRFLHAAKVCIDCGPKRRKLPVQLVDIVVHAHQLLAHPGHFRPFRGQLDHHLVRVIVRVVQVHVVRPVRLLGAIDDAPRR